MKYSQPAFYHFNEDSIHLVNYVIEDSIKMLLSKDKPLKILDLCCGCGVVGIELYLKVSKEKVEIHKIDFLEINSSFEEHLLKNQQMFQNKKVNYQNYFCDLLKFEAEQKYDLIVSNPPYYSSRNFRPSQNHDRNIARTYEEGFMKNFLSFIANNLKPEGKAYFLGLSENSDIHKSSYKIEREKELSSEVSLFSLLSSE